LYKPDAYAVLRIKDFRLFVSARFVLTFAIQMQSVVVGWQVYEITHDVLSLGLIGLAEAIPFILSAIFAGYVADRYNRQQVMSLAVIVYLLGAAMLLTFSLGYHSLLIIFRNYPLICCGLFNGYCKGIFLSGTISIDGSACSQKFICKLFHLE
jgi:MFS family permease